MENVWICHARAIGGEPAVVYFPLLPGPATAQLIETIRFASGGVLPWNTRQTVIDNRVAVCIPPLLDFWQSLDGLLTLVQQTMQCQMVVAFLTTGQYEGLKSHFPDM